VTVSNPMNVEEARAAAEGFRRDFEGVREQIAKAVVGHADIVEGVLTCLFTGGHALLEGVPGLGKTLLIRSLSQALSLDFRRIQFTPDLMPADITGTTIVREGPGGREFVFERGPVFTQILLADESWGCDFEAEIVVVTGDVPRGVSREEALDHIRLVGLVDDVSLRNLIPAELAKGFGAQYQPVTHLHLRAPTYIEPKPRILIDQKTHPIDRKAGRLDEYSGHPQQKPQNHNPQPQTPVDQNQALREHKGIETAPKHSDAPQSGKKRKRRKLKGPKL